jgi:hypothetical protein
LKSFYHFSTLFRYLLSSPSHFFFLPSFLLLSSALSLSSRLRPSSPSLPSFSHYLQDPRGRDNSLENVENCFKDGTGEHRIGGETFNPALGKTLSPNLNSGVKTQDPSKIADGKKKHLGTKFNWGLGLPKLNSFAPKEDENEKENVEVEEMKEVKI